MSCFVPRTFTEIGQPEDVAAGSGESRCSRPLKEYRDVRALVLLGAPGAGKTECLRREAEEGRGHYVTARDFIALDHREHPEWKDGPLLIDGLDEVRAGERDGRKPLDAIRAKLEALGHPDFLLSCREAAWLGASDQDAFCRMKGYPSVRVVRLDPLSEGSVLKILHSIPGAPDAEAFVEQARKEGFEAFLENPQLLTMLAQAAGCDAWPVSRTEVLDRACRAALAEENPEHEAAERNTSRAVDELLDHAGELCALQLLSGGAGWAVDRERADEDFPVLMDLQLDDREGFRRVLDTKLFGSAGFMDGTGRAAPVHRQIAEYLGARFLAKRVGEGLPPERILALMVNDDDNMVVEPLQGLAAWLAALCPKARWRIMDQNPLGVVFDGDPSIFEESEKIALLRRLREEANRNPWFRNIRGLTWRLGDLPRDGDGEVCKGFESASKDEADQGFAVFLAEALHQSKTLSSALAAVLFGGLRENEWSAALRRSVLGVLVHHLKDKPGGNEQLIALLHDFGNGKAPDPDDEFAGRLLRELYPDVIGAPEVIKYLHPRRNGILFGEYYWFWTRNFFDTEELSPERRCELLDLFAARCPAGNQASSQATHALEREVFCALLRKHLEASGESTDVTKLFAWLEALEWGRKEFRGMKEEGLEEIEEWFSLRPDLGKSLLELGLVRHAGAENLDIKIFGIREFLFGIRTPPDFGAWCLERAEKTEDSRIAQYFARQVAWSVHHGFGNQELSVEDVKARFGAMPELLETFTKYGLQRTRNQEGEYEQVEKHRKKRADKRANRRQELKPYEGELRENRAPPGLLHYLATAYFGGYADIAGKTPLDRLRDFADNDEELFRAILSGLRGCLDRDDLPTSREVLRLASRNLRHHLVWPFMAGMEELASETGGREASPDDERVHLAFTIHYAGLVPQFAFSKQPPYPPSWYDPFLERYPEHAENALIMVARSVMRARHSMHRVFNFLLKQWDRHGFSHASLLALLKSFPLRCSLNQLDDLRILLLGALRHCPRDELLRLVKCKAKLASMNTAQRIYWLGIGLRLEPSSYLKDVENYVGKSEKRIAFLLRVFDAEQGSFGTREEGGIGALRLLIKLGGRIHRPWSLIPRRSASDSIPPWRPESDLIDRWIRGLAIFPSEHATRALEALSADERLQAWSGIIHDALCRQRILFANARFRHCSLSDVFETLKNGKPANAADLKELAAGQIETLADDIRDGDTDDWQQYWQANEEEVAEPQSEESCRNRFLSDLKGDLRRCSIASEPEGSHADRKRSDIKLIHLSHRLSHRQVIIPIEVKTSASRDLWSGIGNQLIPRYTRTPESGGHGIYLVFWFGGKHCQPPPEGRRPRNADELRQMLEKGLSDDERRKVAVRVVDVARPGGEKEKDALKGGTTPAHETMPA